MSTLAVDFTFLISTGVTAFYVALYVNFGVILDWQRIKIILKKPIEPCLGFFCNFIFLPLFSYALGLLLFSDDDNMRFALFATGISPMGVASCVWTLIVSGNVELSIVMNVINSLSVYGTTPFWLFTLGTTMVDRDYIEIQYSLMAQFFGFSFVPLLIGILIQYIFPYAAEISKPILMGITYPFAIFIIFTSMLRGIHVFSMPFADSWKYVLAGCSLPLWGYFVAWFLSGAFKFPKENRLSVALSTLNIHSVIAGKLFDFFTRKQRELAVLFPLTAVILAPMPVLIHFAYRKFIVKKL